MNKGTLILGLAGLGVVGFIGYKFIQFKGQGTNGVSPLLPGGDITYRNAGQNSVQPQPRVDNANQPWFGNTSQPNFGISQQAYDMKNLASYLDSGSSIVHSLSDIWGDLGISDLFGKEDSWDDVAAMDWDQPYSWDSNDAGMGEMEMGEPQTDTMYAYV